MSRTWIDLPDDLLTQVKAACEAEASDISTLASRALLNELTTPALPAAPPRLATEDEIAEHFLGLMDPVKARMIAAVTRDRGSRPYNAILAWVMKACDQGESSLLALPGRDLGRSAAPVAREPEVGTCEWCQKAFTMTRAGQIFCPDPDDGTESCGRQAMRAEQRQKLSGPRDPDPYAPRQQPVEAIARMMNTR